MPEEWTVERQLQAGSERGRSLFRRFEELVGACGDFTHSVLKTTVTFRGPKRGFAQQVGCGKR